MKENKENKLAMVVILAAIVAALTTVAILFLRMRAKKRALASYGDTIDYDLDDCFCGEYDSDIDDIENDAPVQIPLADEDDDMSMNDMSEDQ